MNETETQGHGALTWLRTSRVLMLPVAVGMTILTAAVVFAFLQLGWDRDAAATALQRSACETQAEFRSFFTEYLEAQIGTEVEDIPGFTNLSPDAKEFALSLAPIVEAGRQEDISYLAEYMSRFPIPDCSDL